MLFGLSKLPNSGFPRMSMSSPRALDMLLNLHKGIGAKHVSAGDMRSFPMALPAPAEQHRIVAKVDELMVLCDAFARIKAARTTQIHLADAIVEQVIAESDPTPTHQPP